MNKYIRRSMAMAVALSIVGAQMNPECTNLVKTAVMRITAETLTAEQYTYTVNEDDTITITGYTGTDAVLILPETIDGKSISAIGARAFYKHTELTGVAMPDTVTSIGEYAFMRAVSWLI